MIEAISNSLRFEREFSNAIARNGNMFRTMIQFFVIAFLLIFFLFVVMAIAYGVGKSVIRWIRKRCKTDKELGS